MGQGRRHQVQNEACRIRTPALVGRVEKAASLQPIFGPRGECNPHPSEQQPPRTRAHRPREKPGDVQVWTLARLALQFPPAPSSCGPLVQFATRVTEKPVAPTRQRAPRRARADRQPREGPTPLLHWGLPPIVDEPVTAHLESFHRFSTQARSRRTSSLPLACTHGAFSFCRTRCRRARVCSLHARSTTDPARSAAAHTGPAAIARTAEAAGRFSNRRG
jgi:hypothetical protein